MPRRARINASGARRNKIYRNIERRKIIWEDPDRINFLRRLESILGETQTQRYAWAWMPNHFHLLLRIGNASIALVMRQVLSGYAAKFKGCAYIKSLRMLLRWGR